MPGPLKHLLLNDQLIGHYNRSSNSRACVHLVWQSRVRTESRCPPCASHDLLCSPPCSLAFSMRKMMKDKALVSLPSLQRETSG